MPSNDGVCVRCVCIELGLCWQFHLLGMAKLFPSYIEIHEATHMADGRASFRHVVCHRSSNLSLGKSLRGKEEEE